ncbi:UDP-N-acetylmuramoyl-L-alanine--D-glutamate ligase [bacterium]|nr:UDP-N-acetylmuramoyl-L-alanine--D-glutamate ligase [bacterium]
MKVRDKKVGVLGLGKSGIAAANLLYKLGAKVFISEINEQSSLEGLSGNFEIEVGVHSQRVLGNDLIVISPGINPDIPIIKEAKRLNIPIISEIELAFSFLNGQRLVSVTGTNGKTTVTTFIGEVMKNEGRKTVVAGNIGYPLCKAVEGLNQDAILVTEISSFQLENIDKFRPQISLLLNITEDHLDRYFDMEEYTRAKINIFKNQQKGDFILLNADNFRIKNLDLKTPAKIIYFSTQIKVKEGIYVWDNKIISNIKGNEEFICGIEDLKIKGRHNLENVLAVVGVSVLLDVNRNVLRRTISSFSGLEHRLEEVRKISGVTYLNDSKATNIDAMIRALESFSDPIILIAGGRDKKGNFILLRDLIAKKVRKIILLGEAKEKIKNLLGDCVETHLVKDLSQAVNLSYTLAEEGDIVLLSPGCSSYDMFSNFEERGKCFKEEVLKLESRIKQDALSL